MIRLVVSDVDGTLLKRGERRLSKEAVTVIRSLCARGILFAAASGRPYADLRSLFDEVPEKIGFIASDGALIGYGAEVIGRFPIDRETGFEMMREIYMETDAEVALYGSYMAYMLPKSEDFAAYFRETVRNHAQSAGCMRRVPEEYLKIGIYHPQDVEKYAGAVASYWDHRLNRVYSSKQWLEYTAAGVHKGVLAFGDNRNDRELLAMAGCSYAMKSADREIKDLCGYETDNPIGTIKVLFGL